MAGALIDTDDLPILKEMITWWRRWRNLIPLPGLNRRHPKPSPGDGGSSNCILVYFLSFRESDGGYATLRAIFTEEGETPVTESWVINFEDSLSEITTSFNALSTVVANPGVFTLVRAGGDLPDSTVEFRVTATGWTVDFEWDAAGDELEGEHAGFLDRGYKSA